MFSKLITRFMPHIPRLIGVNWFSCFRITNNFIRRIRLCFFPCFIPNAFTITRWTFICIPCIMYKYAKATNIISMKIFNLKIVYNSRFFVNSIAKFSIKSMLPLESRSSSLILSSPALIKPLSFT